VESDVGFSVAVTSQKGKGGVPGRVVSSANVIVVSCRGRDFRLVHGVAAAGMGPITIMANRPTAEPTSKSGRFIALSSLNPHRRGFASWRTLLRSRAGISDSGWALLR